jgi:hypothetical protein
MRESAMDDVRKRIRRGLERIQPSPGAFEDTLRRVRRRERHRRVGAGVVGLALTAVVMTGLWVSLQRERGMPLGSASPSPEPSSVGTRLFLAGDGEMWVVDVDTGSVRHLDMPELSPGDAPHRIVRRDDRLVAWGYQTLVLDPDFGSPPSVLAPDSLIFIPSALEDRVWVGIPDQEGPETACLQAVREMSVDGEVTVPDTRPPGCRWPVAAVEEGLVFQMSDDTLEIWDPRSGAVVRRLSGVFPLAWQGHRMAWCDAQCVEAHITDLSSGVDRVIPLPPGIFHFQGYEGVFSPDGSVLALVGLTAGDFTRADGQLVLVDVETGDARAIQGTVVKPPYNFVDWSASGGSVFITGGGRGEQRRLIEYRPTEDAVSVVPAEVGDFYDIAAF